MSYFDQYSYDKTFPQNLSLVLTNLKDKNIIYSVQYIFDEDVQTDRDGADSTWNINVLCIEKTEDDYIFHFNYSNHIHAYSYPYFKEINKFDMYSKKLSDLKNDFINILTDKSNMNRFINMWNDEYCYAFRADDTNLLTELKSLSDKMVEIEDIYEKYCELERAKYEKEKEEYEKSDAYKQYLQDEINRKAKRDAEYRQEEEERLRRCIELYGEIDGRKFHRL